MASARVRAEVSEDPVAALDPVEPLDPPD